MALDYTVIKSEKQYFAYCEELERLTEQGLDSTDGLERYDLLLLLIEDWDRRSGLSSDENPVEIVSFLLKENGLTQSDLAKITGYARSYISEILNYKKEMPKKFIARVAEHFNIRQEALNKAYMSIDKILWSDIIYSIKPNEKIDFSYSNEEIIPKNNRVFPIKMAS